MYNECDISMNWYMLCKINSFKLNSINEKNLIPKYIIVKGQVIPILKIKYVGL